MARARGSGFAGSDSPRSARTTERDNLLEHLRSQVEAAEAHVLAELDGRDACDATFGMRTAPWVASHAGVAPAGVRQRLRVARLLRERLPLVDEALCDGRLSFDHTRLLAQVSNPRIVGLLAEVQDEIIALAGGCCFERWKTDVQSLIALLDADGPEPDDPAHDSLSMATTLDGATYVKASFSAASGATLRAGIDQATDIVYRRYVADHERCPEIEIPTGATLRALALVELVRLGTIALTAQATDADDPANTSAGSRVSRAELTLVVADGHVTDPDGHPVPSDAAAMWACDPNLWVIALDRDHVPLEAGHTRRLATAAQRRAIAIRDGGCTFPGCDAPIAWADIHHLHHWILGGPTDLPNLAALCRHHHVVTHRPGWTMHTTADQRFWWTTPAGQAIWGQRQHRQHDGPPPTQCDGCHGCQHPPHHHRDHDHDHVHERAA